MRWWAIAFAFALAGCVGAERSGDIRTGPAEPGAIELVMVDNAFQPDRLELETGREIKVQVTNEGQAWHDFTIDDLDLSTGTLRGGDVVTATFIVPDGLTEYRCTIHPGMAGEIAGTV